MNEAKCGRHGQENKYCEGCLENERLIQAEKDHDAAYKQGCADGLEKGIEKAKEVKEA